MKRGTWFLGTSVALLACSMSDIASANSCLRTFDIDETKTISVIGLIDGLDSTEPMSCAVAERLRTDIYVQNPKLFTEIAGMSASSYYDSLQRQLAETEKAIEALEVKITAGQTGGALLSAAEILLFEAAKYELILCLVPDATVSKIACGIALFETVLGGYRILSGSVTKNEATAYAEKMKTALKNERARLADIRSRLAIGAPNEVEQRAQTTFYLLCDRIEASCLKD